MAAFKTPSIIPQDLLMIREMVDVPESKPPVPPPQTNEDSIDSSDSEAASEDEIEAVLLTATDGDIVKQAEYIFKKEEDIVKQEELEGASMPPAPLDSSSDSDSDSDSSSSDDEKPVAVKLEVNEDLDDEEDSTSSGPSAILHTKNEIVVDDNITIPEVNEVGPDEALERVGEVMNIINKVVIVKGLPSAVANRGSDRALDSDTLLVFDDRKVMGYIYETFGPTSQPLYQVKFNNKFPLNPEIVKLDRPVFHVPGRSKFVFVSQLKAQKGSDASNLHDEEPADDELEFSDDEAEAAYRTRLKRKRAGSRARSIASSRHGTPTPSQMRDEDLVDDAYLHGNAYDARGPYDDFNAPGPSRPPPTPYDDPYSDTYHVTPTSQEPQQTEKPTEPSTFFGPTQNNSEPYRPEGRERRGRGRGRGRGDQRRNFRGDSGPRRGRMPSSQNSGEGYDPHVSRSLSPTSVAIAQATGQFLGPSSGSSLQISSDNRSADWGYNPSFMQQQQQFMQMPFVQPHINPRFASNFGMGGMQSPQYYNNSMQQFSNLTPQQGGWTDDWAVPVQSCFETAPPEDNKRTDQ